MEPLSKTPPATARAVSILLLVILAAGPPFAAGDDVATPATLPANRQAAASVWDPRDLPGIGCGNGCLYTFGGSNGAGTDYASIVAYNPSGASVFTVTGASLPSSRQLLSAVWAGNKAYLFGGLSAGAASDEILVFDPTVPSVTNTGDTLPTGLFATSAVWDTENTPACPTGCAYLFGGATKVLTATTDVNTVIQYSPGLPSTPRANVVTTLPTIRSSTSAVWDFTRNVAYVLGGKYSAVSGGSLTTFYLDDILLFNPPAAAPVLVAQLPEKLATASATYDGRCAYHFGGYPTAGPAHSAGVVGFDPATLAVQTMASALPTGRSFTSAAWSGERSYVVGGNDGSPLADIVSYHGWQPATLNVPTNVEAFLSGVALRAWVTWEVPDGDPSYCGALDGFKVYVDGSLVATVPVQPGPQQVYFDDSPSGGCYQVRAYLGTVLGPLSTPPACPTPLP